MALKQQALSGFKKMRDDRVATVATTIIWAMRKNINFPDPNPPLEELQTALDDYTTKLSVANKRGNPEETALKNESKAALALVLKRLSVYVNTMAGDTLSVLLSSGFPVSDYPTAGQPPFTVEGIKLLDGRQSGQIQLVFTRQKGVLLYEYQYAAEKDEADGYVWGTSYRTTSTRDNTIIVTPFIRYYARVRAVNGHGESEWSEAVSHVGR